ncbi:antibiotic biosynthesis monooxygenase [Actinomadura sp. 6K520]|uniref:group II truncated hemoglobin n=1 Tax=Actinomadura sp. 6K520 TaxID=2530364 RepID=UPI00104AE40F|nr:antibiotic biosynthesis monooxygenase [Actinomadura sp. 6K520]TDE33857.1 antibiotic biosynthesis monooxygenase [Actinomadura sp. 6K520]
MIVEYIRYRIDPRAAEEFEAAYARASAALAAAPQCVDYELSRCVEEPGGYVLRIGWTSADDHMKGFRGGEHFPAFFAEIKPYVQAIEEMRHYERTSVRGTGSSVPTMYEWAGGGEALERLTEVFYTNVLKDDLLRPLFEHMAPGHPKWVAIWLGEVFRGPERYGRERGGYHHMVRQHLGRAITEPQRRRWVSLLMDAADETGLPADPEFRAAFTSYIEWGTRIALTNSQPDAEPPLEAPMPHWDWGVAPPYIPTSP